MHTVYVICGETGEYSDTHNWIVCAVSKEQDARDIVRVLDNALQSAGFDGGGAWTEGRAEGEFLRAEYEAANTAFRRDYDPGFEHGYTGTGYHYQAVPWGVARSLLNQEG